MSNFRRGTGRKGWAQTFTGIFLDAQISYSLSFENQNSEVPAHYIKAPTALWPPYLQRGFCQSSDNFIRKKSSANSKCDIPSLGAFRVDPIVSIHF
jgi:hypothetical protein